MSTEHQHYSLDYQGTTIQSYAEQNGFEVVKSYVDPGKSGLALRHRPGLSQLIQDVVSRNQPYRAILVYDVSRWGRFQDSDESAHYEFICRQAGTPIHYCAESFSNDGTMGSSIMKTLKRIMAAEYSRDLSDRMTLAMARLVKDGFWAGSSPGYGLRRLLVTKERTPKHLMNFGDRINLRDDHTILVPGPPNEVQVIKEIFRMYVDEKRSMLFIARRLNEQGFSHGNVPWNWQAVRKILFAEKYVGTLVWGRYTQKLRSRCVRNPREKWIIVPDVFQPVVDRKTFDAAHKTWANRTKQFSDPQYLDALRSLLQTSGRLNARLINESPLTPSSSSYINRFGSLRRAYELIGYTRKDTFAVRRRSNQAVNKVYQTLFDRLRRLFPNIRTTHVSPRARPKTLRFSTGLTVALAVCHTERTLRGEKRWRFESRHAQRSGLVTLLCFSMSNGVEMDFFMVLPSASHIPVVSLLKEKDERLSSGQRLTSLRDFRRVAHQISGICYPSAKVAAES